VNKFDAEYLDPILALASHLIAVEIAKGLRKTAVKTVQHWYETINRSIEMMEAW